MSSEDQARVQAAVACSDCSSIPKVANAGEVISSTAGDYQLMHNGVKIRTDSHYGAYNVEVIRRLRGHHEPQEEAVFFQVLRSIRKDGVIMELGSFWAYYSLWFIEAIPGARAFLVEPDEFRMTAGRRNFALNQREATFIEAAITDEVDAGDRPSEIPDEVRSATVDMLMSENALDQVDLLHADIQGFEVKMLEGASNALGARAIRWIFISTHGENLHQRCIGILRGHGYAIVEEHTPQESYSMDGLIVASSRPAKLPTRISRLRTISTIRAKLRAIARVRILEPLGLRPVTR